MPTRFRIFALSAILLAVNSGLAQSQDKKLAITDVAKAGVDYSLQGEYTGDMVVNNRYWKTVGLQVIAPLSRRSAWCRMGQPNPRPSQRSAEKRCARPRQ